MFQQIIIQMTHKINNISNKLFQHFVIIKIMKKYLDKYIMKKQMKMNSYMNHLIMNMQNN